MASARIADHIGRVLGGRYRLLTPVGTGASAHVFLADDTRLHRRVAVKILHPALAEDAAFLRRFRAEARAAAALTHPNIVAVYDWGEGDDGPFIVTEFLGGGSLRALLDRGRTLTISQALVVGLEAARALDFAHRRGLVHRDIKPANLLFDADGRLRVADFGLARALAEAAWTEPVGAVLGTARYAAPEQVKGVALDGKADIYSLAVVLVEAVTGEAPFAGETTLATLMSRVGRPLDVPLSLGPLASPLYRAGQPEPADRPDAIEFAAALQDAASRLPAPEPLPLAGPAVFDGSPLVADRDPTDVGAAHPGTTTNNVAGHAPTIVGPGSPSAPAPPERARRRREKVRRHKPPRQRRRRWPWVVLVVLLLAGGGVGVSVALIQAQVPTHDVPRLDGKEESQARRELQLLGFNLRVAPDRPYQNDTTVGQVLDQLPVPGTKLKEGKSVTVTVSRGPQPVPVPALVGLDVDKAREAIESIGLKVGVINDRYDEAAGAGKVIESSPPKDVEHPTGSLVDLVVSLGPKPRTVPPFTNRTFDQAKASLEAEGLVVTRSDTYNNDVPKDTVISTSPQASAQVARGSTVTVVVSMGQPVVPPHSGMTREQASAALQGVELRLGNVYGPSGGRIFLQTPVAGTNLRLNTAVDIYVM